MGAGLPLQAHLSPAELAAVIAHQFGHYVSGDVGLGPWNYKARAVMGAPRWGRLEEHARALMRHALGPDLMAQLRQITWEEAGDAVYVRGWHDMARQYAGWLGTRTVDDMPARRKAFMQLGSALVGKREVDVTVDDCIARAVHVLAAGLGSALVRAGWVVETSPGQPIELVRGPERLDPNIVLARLVEGQESADGWQARCEQLGIAGLPLAPAADEADARAS